MMQRLWNGIVPLTLRGSAVSSNAVSSVCLQEIGGDLHALAVCRDLKLRIWSLTTRECVESTDLTLFIPDSKTVQPSTDQDHVLYSVPRKDSEAVYLFAVYLSFVGCAQVAKANEHVETQ
jgi:nuclear pore complex protein Nup160